MNGAVEIGRVNSHAWPNPSPHLSVLSSLREEDWSSEQLQMLNEFFQVFMNAADLISRVIKNYRKNPLFENDLT
jgi:hypothetical protein